MKKIFFVFIAIMVLVASDAFASKAVTRPRQVTLQDGRQITVSLYGDEHFSYWASSTGELIIREGNLWRVATEMEIQAAEQSYRRAANRSGESIIANRPFPHMGNPKALVILVSFADVDFTYPVEKIDALFNSTEYVSSAGISYSSLAQYMNDCSDGQFRPEFDVVGPYKLSKEVGYYGKNVDGNKDINVYELINESCTLADPDVDFSQYDSNGDGYADLVYLYYAGYGENWGGSESYLWPKSGNGHYGSFDNVIVSRYGINNELIGDETFFDADGNPYFGGIGVLTHEFCHTLGLPDVYPYAKWDDVTMYDNQSMEYWDVMDAGEYNYNGYYPTPLTAFERELFGWIEIETLSEPANVEMKPLQDGGKAYRIVNDNDETGKEYYILEAMPSGKNTGWYRRMRGDGLLVTHINYDANLFSNFGHPNDVHGSPRWTIIPADGMLATSYRTSRKEDDPYYMTSTAFYAELAGDTYPGTSNVTELTDYKAYTGEVEKPITEISQDGFNISFKFMGGLSGIKTIDSANDAYCNTMFNLQGQKVGDDYKGIVIRGGKKVLRK